jgi:hypothetical protein
VATLGEAPLKTVIAKLPNSPTAQNDKRIKACPQLITNQPLNLLSPISKGIRRLRCECRQTNKLQKLKPEFSCKDTANQEMLDIFLLLIT